jgi:hypothetical protein
MANNFLLPLSNKTHIKLVNNIETTHLLKHQNFPEKPEPNKQLSMNFLPKTTKHLYTSMEIPSVIPQSKSLKITLFQASRTLSKINETVNNFSQPTHRYTTSSNILVNGEAANCLIDTGAFTSFISTSYFKSRCLSRRPLTINKQWVTANDLLFMSLEKRN